MSLARSALVAHPNSSLPESVRLPRPAPDGVAAKRYIRRRGRLERLLAAGLLIPALPLIGLLIVLVRLTSRGPGIFRQVRVGQNGKIFMMYKIRTMAVDAEVGTGAVWAGEHDPRITPLGRTLRDFHLDELPQLFNVLRGDMALVGPRPERPEFVRVLSAAIPGYQARLAVPPGVTGLAQLNLPADTDLHSVQRKLILDLEYLRTASFWLDCRVLLCTLLHLLGLRGSHALRMVRLERTVANEDLPETVLPGQAGAWEPTPAATPLQIEAQVARGAEGSPRGRLAAGNRVSASVDPCPQPRTASVEEARESALTQQLAGAFTVDVEDYFQVTAFENDIPRERWHEFDSRVVANTQRILELLARYQVRGTFFVLGWTAERHPRLVEEIHAAGHQIGSHGYWHRRIYEQGPDEFRRDLQRSRDVLIDITGQKIRAYRAPCFSVTKRSLWALDILTEEGFDLDCSIFPIHHDRYGIPDAEQRPHRIATSAGLLWEFPPATRRLAGLNLPIAGGGYFRLLPAWWTIRSLQATRQTSGRPFIFYIHPWEVDPAQPRLPAGSRLSRLRHHVNLARTEGKLETLLRHFCFSRLDEVLNTLCPPPECRFAERRPTVPSRPTRPVAAAQPGINGQPAFRRSPKCRTCSWNVYDGPHRVCRCRAPVYELAASTGGVSD